MNLKHILLLLLAFGVMFAWDFPDKISGTDLELDESIDSGGYGVASYTNDDESNAVLIATKKTSKDKFYDDIGDFIDEGTKESDMGIDYYTLCLSSSLYAEYGGTGFSIEDFQKSNIGTTLSVYRAGDDYSEGNVCIVCFYYDTNGYMLIAYSKEGTQSETKDLAIKVGKEVAGIGPLGTLCSCPVGLVFIGLTFAGLAVKK